MDLLTYVQQRKSKPSILPGIDFHSLITFQTSLSDGISKFAPPKLYTAYCQKEVESAWFIKKYSIGTGYPALNEAIKQYEKIMAVPDFDVPDQFADHVCVTAGASAAIVFFFEWFSLKYPKEKVLFLGLNYHLFYECMHRYQIDWVTWISQKKNRVAPTMDEVMEAIDRENPKLVSLTLPFNPSGEIYSEPELRRLINVLKKREIILLFDKCQLDEFASPFEFVNLNRIAIEEGFIDHLVIINSISKTRSLPGARLGYIIANQEIMTYVSYINELVYWNAPLIYLTPFITDLLFRIIYMKQKENPEINVSFITKAFRNFILTMAGAEVYLNFFKTVLNTSDLQERVQEFCNEVDQNAKIVYRNYQYTIARLGDHLTEVTELQGGYNFCIKICNTGTRGQLQFCAKLTEAIRVALLPEYCYNDHYIDDTDEPFWIRITAAYPEEQFRGYMDQLAQYLDAIRK